MKMFFSALTVTAITGLAACGASDDMDSHENMGEMEKMDNEMDHSEMEMSGSGEVPTGLEVSENPTFEVGDTAIITADHMEGMKGAKATIVGAFETVAYSISYDPTSGGQRVENHKWIIHEEIQDASDEPYKTGDEVKVNADHMEGMDGAIATIDYAEETTVYMVDFEMTTTGDKVKNHKWVTEDELTKQ